MARAGERSSALPRDESTFFGREAERADVLARIDGGARLLTVTGLGGVGKSRLAVVCAEALASRGLDVAFVSLAESTSLESSVRAVARACGVRLSSESRTQAALKALGTALSEREGRVLVVLDEAEPRTTASKDLVSGLLAQAPSLVVLATAREPLGVKAEEKLLLGPLSPEEATRLLFDRARLAAGRDVEMDDAIARAIVAKTDALPLAVELAAARLDVLTPSELLARLGTMPALRASLEASWQLLDASEQRTLAQISVLAGVFDVDTAERIVDLGPDAETDVVDVLSALVQRCFVVRAGERGPRARLRVLETVRSWARGKLDELGLAEATSRRHLELCLATAERWAKATYGESGTRALDALAELLPDALTAFQRWKDEEPALAARLVVALSDLLLFRGLVELRAELLEAAVAAAERAGDERVLARALALEARVHGELGSSAQAEQGLHRAALLAAKVGDETTRLDAARTLGWMQIARGQAEEAQRALEDVRERHRARGEARGQADACAALGVLFALTGRRAEALASLQAALGIHVETGDTLRQEKVLGFGALAGFDAKELARGLPRDVLSRAPARSIDVLPASVAEMVASEAEAGRRWRDALDDYLVGAAAEGRGDTTGALAAFERAIGAFRSAGMPRGLAAVQAHAAVAFEATGDAAEADARLAAARNAAGQDPALTRVVDAFAAATGLVRARRGGKGTKEAQETAERELARAELVEGAPPELASARAVLARLLGAPDSRSAPVPVPGGGPELVVGPESRWYASPGGARVDLVRYGPVRRLLDKLVEVRLEKPGAALSAEDLIAAGWPGERMRHTAGLLRVYSGIRRLRRMGLENVLVTRDDGYLLDPNVVVKRAAS